MMRAFRRIRLRSVAWLLAVLLDLALKKIKAFIHQYPFVMNIRNQNLSFDYHQYNNPQLSHKLFKQQRLQKNEEVGKQQSKLNRVNYKFIIMTVLTAISRIKYQPFRIFSVGRVFMVKHFIVDWAKFKNQKYYQISSPLVSVHQIPLEKASQRELNKLKNPIFVIFMPFYYKAAPTSSMLNSHREQIMKALDKMPYKLPKNSCINIKLTPACKLATSAQIIEQILQLVEHNEPNRSKPPPLKIQSLFTVLFPFRYGLYSNYIHLFKLQKSFSSQMFNYDTPYIIAHHYKIKYACNLKEMTEDIADFLKVIEKFNFFQFISKLFKVKSGSRILSKFLKLIRIMKWRTPESEDYLIFLLKAYGHEDIKENLRQFLEINAHYNNLQVQGVKIKTLNKL